MIFFNRLLKYFDTDFYNPTIFTSPTQATKNGWLLAAGGQRSIVFYLCCLQLGFGRITAVIAFFLCAGMSKYFLQKTYLN